MADLSSSRLQFPSNHIKIGQGKQGKCLHSIPRQSPITHIAIAPQVLDDTKAPTSWITCSGRFELFTAL